MLLVPLALGAGCAKAPTSSLTLQIDGMVCDSCAHTIQQELLRLDGVAAARVTYNSRKARITYSPDRIGAPALLLAVEKLGYKARLR